MLSHLPLLQCVKPFHPNMTRLIDFVQKIVNLIRLPKREIEIYSYYLGIIFIDIFFLNFDQMATNLLHLDPFEIMFIFSSDMGYTKTATLQ